MIELMIALVIGALLIASSSTILFQAVKAARFGQAKAQMQQAAEVAKLFLERDIRKTGFYAVVDTLSQVDGSTKPTQASQACSTGGEEFVTDLSPQLFGLNNHAQQMFCVEKHKPQSDILVLRYLHNVETVSKLQSEKNKMYLKASLDEGRLFKAKDESHYKNVISSPNYGIYEVRSYIYYLRETDRRCHGEPVLGLFREYNANDSYFKAEEIIGGVEQLQFQYYVDGKIKNANQITTEEWNVVSLVIVYLLLRSECPEFPALQFLTNSDELADVTLASDKNDGYLRQSYVFNIALRNAFK